MDWLNLHISVLDSPQVLRCDPVRRATWLFLLRYCISQENGGVIQDCSAWGDTSWQQIVRVKLREVRSESPLWTWEGDSLRVTFYPSEKETEVQAKRELARTNGKRGGRPKKTEVGSENETNEKPTLVNSPKAEGNGMEGEGEREIINAAAGSAWEHPGEHPAQPAAAMTRSWMDWKLTIGRHRVYLDREGNSETHWAELYSRAGWDEFTKAWEYCAKKAKDGKGKIFLANMLEVLS